jgi:hypothetical protein
MNNDLDELEAGPYRPFDLWRDPELLRARSTALTELIGSQPPTRGVSPQREARWVRAQLEWLSTQHEGRVIEPLLTDDASPPGDPPASRASGAVVGPGPLSVPRPATNAGAWPVMVPLLL